jgi:hypothetical protein
MQQAGRSRVLFPMRSLDSLNWPHPSSRTVALGPTQPSIQWVPAIFLGVKGSWCTWLTTSLPSVSPLSKKCGRLDVRQNVGPTRSVTAWFHLKGLSVRLLGFGISQSQGPYIHRITQPQKESRPQCLQLESNWWSECSDVQRHLLP